MSRPDRKLKLLVQRTLPEPVKRVLRIVRLATVPAPLPAPDLPQESIDKCQFLSTRIGMLDRMTKGGVVAELGVLRGEFSREILLRLNPSALHLVDVDFSMLQPDVANHKAVRLHRGLTSEIVGTFEDQSFDFIYIDADHSYEAVRQDIQLSNKKLKPNGVLAFNDFGRIVRPGFGVFGVHQAVCEFVVAERWQVVYFCFHGEALYDIALRKPLPTAMP